MRRSAESTSPAPTGIAMIFSRDFAGLAAVIADNVPGITPTLVSLTKVSPSMSHRFLIVFINEFALWAQFHRFPPGVLNWGGETVAASAVRNRDHKITQITGNRQQLWLRNRLGRQLRRNSLQRLLYALFRRGGLSVGGGIGRRLFIRDP